MNTNMKDFLESITFKKLTYGIGILIIALLIFQAGEFVGYRKASFSYKFGERYYKETFGRNQPQKQGKSMAQFPMMDRFSETHGATGKIVKISLPTIVLDGEDNIEKIITLSTSTMIRQQRNNLKPTDLRLGDSITVIGAPNDKAEIEAKLIRLLPVIKPEMK